MKHSLSQPAEWTPHAACWMAWPSHGHLWEENLVPAQKEFTALCRAISGVDVASSQPLERLEILVPDSGSQKDAEKALHGLPVKFHRIPFGDIWLRDTAPIFVWDGSKKLQAACFQFNGWGGKYDLPHDKEVSRAIAAAGDFAFTSHDWVLEGGSVDVDGEGTCLTTKQCLLNPNRNQKLSQAQIEEKLKNALGVSAVLWIKEGLLNDHTDGHIDTIARFIAPGTVLCMHPGGSDDPNAGILKRIQNELESMVDAQGRNLKVVTIPSPGKVVDEDGEIMPASYVNFYISNRTVVVPTYGVPNDAAAVNAIAAQFPNRKTVGLSAKAILSGGGAFHCITQQEPLVLLDHLRNNSTPNQKTALPHQTVSGKEKP